MDLEKPIIPFTIVLLVCLILLVGFIFDFSSSEQSTIKEQEALSKAFDNTFTPVNTQEELNSKIFTNIYGDYPWSIKNRGEVSG